jgi:voltage-dependent calcium channel
MIFGVSPELLPPSSLELVCLMRYADDFFLFVTVMYVVDIFVRFYGLGWRSFRANGWNIFDVVVASGSLLTTISVRVGASGYVIDQLQKLFLVSIAFKLVQRMNNLNKLFKTAVYVVIRHSPSLLLS